MQPKISARSIASQVRPKLPLLAFVASVLGLILIGLTTYQTQRDQTHAHIEAQLRAIGDFRVAQLTRWQAETRAASEFLAQGGQIADHFAAWTESGYRDPARATRILARMTGFQKVFGYYSVSLFDTTGQYRLGDKFDPAMAEHQSEALQAMRKRAAVLVDFHRHGNTQILGMMVPLIKGESDAARIVGAVFIAISARDSLFPLFSQWPTPSRSGETVLARAQGDQIQILFASRNSEPLGLISAQQHPHLASARVLRGESGLFRAALDYRGNPVLAYGSRIPGTLWSLLVKQDQVEVDAPVQRIAMFSALGTGALMLFSGLFFWYWWRGQIKRRQVQLIGEEAERRVLERRYDYLSRYASDVIALADEQGRILEINERVQSVYGYTPDELIGQSAGLLSPPETRDACLSHYAEVLAAGNLLYEAEHRRKDGSRFMVEVSARLIEIQGRRSIHLLIRDISERNATQQALIERETEYRAMLETSADGFWVTDLAGRLLEVNDAYVRRSGYSREELLDMRVSDLEAQENPEEIRRHIEQVVNTGSDLFETKHRCKDDSLWNVELNVSYSPLAGGRIFAFIRDIDQRKREEERLRQAATVFDNTRDGITITDARANILTVNSAFCAITGYSEAEVLGRNPRILKSGRHDAAFYTAMWTALRVEGHWSGEIWNRRKDGRIYPEWLGINAVRDAAGETIQYIAVSTDLSAGFTLQAKLDYQSKHSPLTGLPNVQSLLARIEQNIQASDAESHHLALLVFNIDRFAQLNETLGRAVGDQVLLALARRWGGLLGDDCLLTHQGADQFAVLRQGVKETHDAIETAAHLRDSMREPIAVKDGDKSVALTLSIGVALYPADASKAAALLHAAEDAMRSAKADKGNQVRFYDQRQAAKVADWFETEAALRGALLHAEFFLAYQPQIDTATGRIVAAEALIRWRRGEKVVQPGSFIHVVEGTDLAEPVSRWVLQAACRQAKQWMDRQRPLRVAVNIFSGHVTSGHLLDDVSQALASTGLPAHLLELEVVESSLLVNPELAAQTLRDLKRMGVGLALDDFGTGYSSLGYLKHYPFDVLKIDQMFTRNVNRDPEDAAIVRSTIALARNLGMRVLAEGVETESQLRFLARYGCEQLQGYLLCRPSAPEAVETGVMERRDLRPGNLFANTPTHGLLVLEDEPVEANLLCDLLQDAGYRVYLADNLDKALALMGANSIDLILSDHYLKQTTGVDILERIRRFYPEVPGIMISGADEQAVVVDAINRAGIRAFLAKPLDADVLLRHVRDLLHKTEQA